MARAVAFLRGINVGGHRVKMDDLRAHFGALGLKNVETFIASGNVIFDAPRAVGPAFEKKIEQHLEKVLGFGAPTAVRTLPEIAAAVRHKAFPSVKEGDSLWVFFLRSEGDAALESAVAALASEVEDFHLHGRELYWLVHGKVSQVSRAWPKIEKLMKAGGATGRNITTLAKIVELHG